MHTVLLLLVLLVKLALAQTDTDPQCPNPPAINTSPRNPTISVITSYLDDPVTEFTTVFIPVQRTVTSISTDYTTSLFTSTQLVVRASTTTSTLTITTTTTTTLTSVDISETALVFYTTVPFVVGTFTSTILSTSTHFSVITALETNTFFSTATVFTTSTNEVFELNTLTVVVQEPTTLQTVTVVPSFTFTYQQTIQDTIATAFASTIVSTETLSTPTTTTSFIASVSTSYTTRTGLVTPYTIVLYSVITTSADHTLTRVTGDTSTVLIPPTPL